MATRLVKLTTSHFCAPGEGPDVYEWTEDGWILHYGLDSRTLVTPDPAAGPNELDGVLRRLWLEVRDEAMTQERAQMWFDAWANLVTQGRRATSRPPKDADWS